MENISNNRLDQNFSQIRAQLGGYFVKRESARSFLAFWEEHKQLPAGLVEDLSNADQKTALSTLIFHLARGDMDGANEVATRGELQGRYLTQAAEIALDITIKVGAARPAYTLLTNFLLGQERFTNGILLYVQWLVQHEEPEEAAAVMDKSRDELLAGHTREVGMRLFKEAMTFDAASQKRDYQKGMAIADMFLLDPAATHELANREYEINMYQNRYETAAMLGKFYDLGTVKTREAALRAFEKCMRYFQVLLDRGYYENSSPELPDDPYRRAVELVQEYFQSPQPAGKDDAGRTYAKKVSEMAFNLAKKLTAQKESAEISFRTRAFFTASLIQDFRLDMSLFSDQADQARYMIGWLAEQIEELLRRPVLTPQFLPCVKKLLDLSSTHQDLLQRITLKMFRYYLRENDLQAAAAVARDMKLPDKEVLEILQVRVLILLNRGQYQDFKEMVELFKLEKPLRTDAELNRRLLKQFELELERKNWEGAQIIDTALAIPKKQIIRRLSRILQRELAELHDEDALDLMHRYRIFVQRVRPVFVNEYVRRAAAGAGDARMFRLTFRLHVLDVGIWNWLIYEVLQGLRDKWFKPDAVPTMENGEQ